MSEAKYQAVYEQAPDSGWSGHVPELPTILVGAETREEAEVSMREANRHSPRRLTVAEISQLRGI
jgi:predicted RNase H-like HicB family nuclease